MSKSTITLTVNSGPKQGESLTRNTKSTVRIGRVVKGNTLVIKDTSISQKHLTIHFDLQTAQWILTDLGSANGTIVNGVRVSNESVKVSDGDAVRIGESTEIIVKVLVEQVKIGEKRRRNVQKDEISEPNLEANENSKTVVKEDDNAVGLCKLDESTEVDEGCGSGSVCEPKHAAKFKRKNASKVLNSVGVRKSTVNEKKSNGTRKTIVERVDVLDSSLNLTEDKEVDNVEKSVNQNVEVASIKDHAVKATDDDLQKNLGRGRKRNCAKALKKNTAIKVPKSSTKGRKQMCTRGSKKDLNMESSDARENILSTEELNASYTVNNGVAEVKTTVRQNLTRGRRGKSTIILDLSPSEKIESSINERKVPNITNKPILEDKTATATMKKGRRGKYNKISIAEVVVKESPKVSRNVRRGRSSKNTVGLNEELRLNLVDKDKGESSKYEIMESGLKNDVGLEDKTKITRGAKRTSRSIKALEDNTEVQKITRGGKRTAKSTQVIDENETQNMPPDEDKIAVTRVTRRGRRNNTSIISKIDEKLESIAENRTTTSEVSNLYGVGEKKPRTRASSRVLKAQVESKDPIISHKENPYVLENPIESKMQKADDEENRAVLPENENAGKQNHEVNHKVWIGNGIPNSTTKYKEDQTIKWHGTPFEERVERALSDERFFPQRNAN